MSSETNRLGKTTHYYYNSSGNKIREEFDIYKFYYRDHGELTEVKVNDVTKVTYNYNASTDLLESVAYANGDTEYYTYTSNNDVYSRRWNNGSAYVTYGYNMDNELTAATNYELGLYYEYGPTGNSLSVMRYDDENTPAETISFTYGNSVWQDELTSVNGTALTYNAGGNVLTYGDKTFSWSKGRQLQQITEGSNTYRYLYDQDGIRFSKTVNGTTTTYTTKDGVILAETTGGNTMFFQYDNFGNPYGFVRYNTQYLYLTNQMGDVIGITDTTGNLIATYSYGAWGEVLAVTPATPGNATQLAIANANPLRYRGYYYDTETSYYYLQSRYYDPGICRFLNADEYIMVQESSGLLCGANAFVYGGNTPANNHDYTGKVLPAVVIKAIGKMLGGIMFQYAQDIIYNVINLGKNATWNKALKRRSAIYVYAGTALSALIPGSKTYRNVASAGLNALATTFESYAKSKTKITKKNLPTYILKFIKDFGFNYICERLTRSFDVQLKNLKPAQVKAFKGNPLIKKGINSFRTTHVLIVNKTKNYLSTHHSMITNWGNAIVQAVNKKYG